MRTWLLNEIDVEPRLPEVLHSTPEARLIAIQLPAGAKLGEHQVHERGWLLVVGGHIEVSEPDGEWASGGAGLLVEFDPSERHEISATESSRLLLVLAPWPGVGHPSRDD